MGCGASVKGGGGANIMKEKQKSAEILIKIFFLLKLLVTLLFIINQNPTK